MSEETRKRVVLVSSYGAGTYSFLRNFAVPAKPSEKSYNELIRAINEH